MLNYFAFAIAPAKPQLKEKQHVKMDMCGRERLSKQEG